MAAGPGLAARSENISFWKSAATAALLFVFTIAAYLPLLRCSFISFDDPTYVTDNFHVEQGISWKGVKWAFTSFDGANWHPLTWLSHMADVQMFGMHAAGHHLTSILLHAINVSLLFLLLFAATRRSWRNVTVAAIFALHPLAVESVAWIAERKNLLSTFFWLLAFVAYGSYAIKPSLKRYLAVVLLFGAGLMAKPMLVTLPLSLLVLDYWPLRRFSTAGTRRLLLEKVPLFLLSLASSVMTVKAQQYEGAVNPAAFPLGLRVEQALLSYCGYLAKIFAPVRLSIIYTHLQSSLPPWQLAALIALLAAIIAVSILARRQAPYLIAGWIWYLVTLVPVSGIVQVGSQGMADRYAYVPMLGIIVAAVWLTADAFERAPNLAAWIPVTAAAVAAVALLALTLHQESCWRNDETLFTHALEVEPNAYQAHDQLGMAAGQRGDVDRARQHFFTALTINPRDQIAHLGLGYSYNYTGDVVNAEKEFRITLANTSDRTVEAETYSQLASLAWKQHRLDDARQDYLLSVAALPRPRPYADLGFMALDVGKFDDAIRYFTASNDLLPSGAAYYGLGHALHWMNRDNEALRALHQALTLSPGFKPAENEIKSIEQR